MLEHPRARVTGQSPPSAGPHRSNYQRREAEEKQRRREREDELAREEHTQKVLADKLIADSQAWELVGRLRQYLTAMEPRIAAISDNEERTAAVEWILWCQRYRPPRSARTTNQDAGGHPPDYSQLQEARKRLGFRESWW